jgi:Ca2+-transporting ATPase
MQRTGLTIEQVAESRTSHGTNKLPEAARVSKLQILLSQFLSPLIFILLVAGLLTFLLGEYTDTIAIVAIILVNTLLGFSQEYRAQRALEALKRMIKPQVEVIRAGKTIPLTAEELVVGDLVKLQLGERVPADGFLVEASGFSASEAVLTGEAAAISKQPGDESSEQAQVFMGTVVVSGVGLLQVTRVGINTEFGKIAETLSTKEEEQTPLQKKLQQFSKQIGLVVLCLAAVIFVIGYFLGVPDFAGEHSSKLGGLITLCVSVAVSAIPEGLIIALTVVLTLSMQRLLKRKALVRKLVVAETLGSVTTICVDKTGTITEGRMRVLAASFSDEALALQALRATNKDLNAVDTALNKWLETQPPVAKTADNPLFDIPFNSSSKFAASVHKDAIFLVGAPEVLLKAVKLAAKARAEIEQQIQAEAGQGHRVIAVATRENNIFTDEKSYGGDPQKLLANLQWLGTITIEDPVRKDAHSAFELLSGAGIKIKVITGDQRPTAVNVMGQVGFPVQDSEMLSGAELQQLDDDELKRRLPEIKLFYRTVPEQKLRIVELLKQCGEVVGMMGDGINDAPALKKADVGIAVDNATEVSKETADIVLLDNNLHTIAAAVEEGRTIFENIKKVITYLLSDGTAEIFLIVGSLLLGLPLPLIPLQILFINLIADGFPDTALAFEPAEQDVMRDKPRHKDSQIIDKEMITLIGIIGLVVNAFIFVIYLGLLQTDSEIHHIRSYIFLLMAVDSLLYVFSIRSLKHNLWEINPFANKVLNLAVLTGFGLVWASFHIPLVAGALELEGLSLLEVLTAVLLGVVKIFIIELIKYAFIVKQRRQKNVKTQS